MQVSPGLNRGQIQLVYGGIGRRGYKKLPYRLSFRIPLTAFFRLIDPDAFPSGQLEHFFIFRPRSLNFQRASGDGKIIVGRHGHEVIQDPYDVKPRRIWDLYSNRVIPFRWFELIGITHPPISTADSDILGTFGRECARVANFTVKHTLKEVCQIAGSARRGHFRTAMKQWSTLHVLNGAAISSLNIVAPKRRSALVAYPDFWAVSHSWVTEDCREYISSIVNQLEWEIPIPHGVTIEDIRRGLRSHAAEYAWLDILCLHQHIPNPESKSGAEEKNLLMQKEKRIDVPTIGNVYQQATKVLY